MRTRFHDVAFFQHVDAVGVEDGAEAVRDEQGNLAAFGADVADGPGDFLLGQGVEGGGSFVEEEEFGAAQQGAGDGDALFFAAREFEAPFADGGFEALFGTGEQVIARGFRERLQQVRFGGSGVHEEQVFPDGAGKKLGVLRDEADLAAQVVEMDGLLVEAVVEDAAVLRAVETHKEFHQGGFAAAAGADKSDGFAGFYLKTDVVERVLLRRLVAESHVPELQRFDVAEVFGVSGLGFGLLLHQVFKVVKRGFGLPVAQDDVADFLQGAEYEKRKNLHGHDFTRRQLALVHQPHEHEQDELPQGVDEGALYEADAADALHLGELQLEDVEGVFVEALDLLFGQAKAFHQLDVAQRFRGGAGQRGGLFYNNLLDFLHFFAEQIRHPGEQKNAAEVNDRQAPMLVERIQGHKNDAHDDGEQYIDEGGNELLRVGAHLLKDAEGFAAALVFKLLIRQFHGVLQTIGEDGGPEFLGDEVEEIILKCFGDSAHHGHRNGTDEQPHEAVNKDGFPGLVGDVFVDEQKALPVERPRWSCRHLVVGSQRYQLPKNDGVNQRKPDVDAGQQQDQ